MNVFDYISLAVIAFFTIICAIKGLRRMIFKLCAITLAILISKYCGEWLLEKANISLDSAIGLFVIFLLSYIILRLVFKIIEGKLDKTVRSILIDRLLGALVGFFVGLAVIFAFIEVVDIVGTVASLFNKDYEFFHLVDNSVIFRWTRNLN